MSLLNLIRGKRESVGFATATPATFATQEAETGRSVATVAVAKTHLGQSAHPEKVGADDQSSAGGDTMSLLNLIRGKRESVGFATATSATSATFSIPATQEAETGRSVATAAVAKPHQGQSSRPEKVGADDPATTSRWCQIHYPDCDPVVVACCPEATHADMLEGYSSAIAAEPDTPKAQDPDRAMTPAEETAIRARLALIGETDLTTIAGVIVQCQQDADAREYFTGRAIAEFPKPVPIPDDRRTCKQCANLIAGRCTAAKRGEIVASRHYEPIRDLPRRCEGYAPGAADTDRRPGRERWPGLVWQRNKC